ncbi:MAG: class I SAM-dependent methyltransferase [Acidobacteria bacterium]|nr:class I SAM-dependent methyltransferase [Acidobacteriota bacterium]
MDPLAGSQWSAAGTVAGFARSAPNAVLMDFAAAELRRAPAGRAIDVGCGAGRNAVPLARAGWTVIGTDLSWPMLAAAAARAGEEGLARRFQVLLAPMEQIPAADRSVDLVIAHGIWNLARSSAQFRQAACEAARVAKPGAGLFIFTFSRKTFTPDAQPVAGEPFVFTQFSGEPQVFLDREQLVAEMREAGFALDDRVPFREYDRPNQMAGTGPVIYEAAFRRTS